MRFVLYVEGESEAKILPALLQNWIRHRLGVEADFGATINFKGCGGFIKEIGSAARRHLDSDEGQHTTAAIGLLDLKGPEAHGFYPEDCRTVASRYEYGVDRLQNEVDHPKFRMYFAVHEIEAWLLSQQGAFPEEIWADLVRDMPDPEEVDFDEPPAKRIARIYNEAIRAGKRRNPYRKVKMGIPLFNSLDLNIARKRCPYLCQMLDDIIEIVRAAMPKQ